MILLPTLPTKNTENSVKPAGLVDGDSAFAAVLAGETEDTGPEGGKILPEGGKTLPDRLPGALARQIARKILSPAHAKPVVETPTNEIETDTDTGEAEPTPKGAEVLTAILLAIEVPLKLDSAQPASAAEPEGDAPARAPESKSPALSLSLPGIAQSPEEAPQPAEAKPDRHAPLHAAQALLAALRQPANAATKQSPAEPASAPEQALAAAAEAAPAIAQETSRPTKAARSQPRREVTLELAKQAKAPVSPTQPAKATALSIASAVQPVVTDAAAPAQGAKPVPEIAAQNQTIRPHEFAALVDRLVEARESVRPTHGNLNVMHADFGRVSVQFGQDNGNLTVSLANNDPGFVPAVNAAVAADASSNGDSTFQGGRRDEGGQSASSRSAAESNTGDRAGRDGSERQLREDRIKPQPQFANRGERKPLGGIFA